MIAIPLKVVDRLFGERHIERHLENESVENTRTKTKQRTVPVFPRGSYTTRRVAGRPRGRGRRTENVRENRSKASVKTVGNRYPARDVRAVGY